MRPYAPDIIKAIRNGADPADCFILLLKEHCGSMAASIWQTVEQELGQDATRPHEEVKRCD